MRNLHIYILIYLIIVPFYSFSQDYASKGNELYNNGKYSDAIKQYEAAIALLKSKDISESDRTFSELQRQLVRAKKCVPLMYDAEILYMNAKKIDDYNKAIKAYQQILTINANDNYSIKQIDKCAIKIKQLNAKKIDDDAWIKASQGNPTKKQYEEYLAKYPNGIHAEEAKKGIIKSENLATADAIFQEGKRFYTIGMYDAALKKLNEAAEMGSAKAINGLGVCYLHGNGVSKNAHEAVRLFRKAASYGDDNGQNNLGDCYLTGTGVDTNYSEALKWFRKAAAQGNAKAQNNIGYCYIKGFGVSQNYTEARKWYEKAAEQNEIQALHNLALCYYKGYGGPANKTKAVELFQKAARMGHSDSKKSLITIGQSW